MPLSAKLAAVDACEVHRLAVQTLICCGRPCFPEQMHWDAFRWEVANTESEMWTSNLQRIAASNTASQSCWHGCSTLLSQKMGEFTPKRQSCVLCMLLLCVSYDRRKAESQVTLFKSCVKPSQH